MGLLNFFKRKTKPEIKPTKINFSEIESWLTKKEEQLNKKEAQIFSLIEQRMNIFFNELNEKLKILKSVDIESKKVEDRAKIIVRESLERYVGYVDTLTSELKKLKKQNLAQFIADINKIFFNFDKHSNIFYQRATFLIGNEIADVREEIKNLYKYLVELLNENKEIIDSSEKLSKVRLKLKQVEELNSDIKKINSEIVSLNQEIGENKKIEKEIVEEIEKTKKSKNYLENLKKQEEILADEKKLEEDVFNLKKLIDFKKLKNVFHADEKKMEIIKDYEKNFKTSLNSTDNILDLLDEAGLNSPEILEKIREINKKKEEIDEKKKSINEDLTKNLMEELRKVRLNIEDLEIEKSKQMRREAAIKKNKEAIIEEIKNIVADLSVVVD